MAIGAFPLIKLGALALRQISKPLASHLKVRARNSDFFRNKICIPTGQFYHKLEVHVKARVLNLGRPTEIARLNETAAIDLGSELIGEAAMFVIAAATIVFEYARQSRKSADEKAAYEARLQNIETAIQDLTFLVHREQVARLIRSPVISSADIQSTIRSGYSDFTFSPVNTDEL